MSRVHPLRQRFAPLIWLGCTFVVTTALTRLALLIATGGSIPLSPLYWLYVFGVGFGYDLLAFVYFAWPLVLLLWLLPRRALRSLAGRWSVGFLDFVLLAVILFVAIAEWTFWDEFQTRFNFIAVDYLVYTNEVIGNVRESYPVGWILGGLALVTLVVFFGSRRWRRIEDSGSTFRARSAVVFAWLAISVLGTWFISGDMKERTANEYVNELAGDGIYEFFAAFRSSKLDYDRFYRTMPLDHAFAELRRILTTPDATFVSADPMSITRNISNPGPEQKLNVVLISVESLSAYYSGTYGNKRSLTPELDKLSDHSLVFDNLYASGTRTVRGLEALALSVPPTPGESIVKRADNENLFSLGDVFNSKGYVSEFLYGGYGAFDNMNYFFDHNGYKVLDRGAIAPESIHHGNIWGVADEDLYTLALNEFDRVHADGKPFFAHIMTTSNHRPYTFPENRIDMPQGSRDSAVVYTDWAIGDFVKRARDKPWFADTVFVITADHCASSGGIAALPVFRYHIPMWVYSPAHIPPRREPRMIGQIDIGPTLLGLLGMSYRSEFYGADLFRLEPGRERGLLGNYQRLGYLRGDQMIELAPHQVVINRRPAYGGDAPQPEIPMDERMEREAIAYYQTASYRFTHGMMKHVPVPDAAPPNPAAPGPNP